MGAACGTLNTQGEVILRTPTPLSPSVESTRLFDRMCQKKSRLNESGIHLHCNNTGLALFSVYNQTELGCYKRRSCHTPLQMLVSPESDIPHSMKP